MSGSRSCCFSVAYATSEQQMLIRRCFWRCFQFFKSNKFYSLKSNTVKHFNKKGALLLFKIYYINATKQQMLKLWQ